MRISGSSAMIICTGIVLAILGFILLLFDTSPDMSFGGLVMIGPIPIAFGTSPHMTALSMIAGIVLMLLYFTIWKKYGQLETNYSIEDVAGDNNNTMKKNVRGGGVVMIGPIPIIIGTDSKSVIIVLAIALTILLIKLVFG